MTMMMTPTTTAILTVSPSEPQFTADAELYFLPAGHFLFRQRTERGTESKFVTLADVAAAFTKIEVDSGWTVPGVQRHGYGKDGPWFVYWQPPQIVKINFDEGDHMDTLSVPIPATVLIGSGNRYRMVALNTLSGGFYPRAEIFNAPFPNIHSDNSVCWGNNTPPESNPRNAPKAWRLFFEAAFNNHLVSGKSKRCKDDIRILLRKLAGKKAKAYPVKDLVQSGRQTVASMLRQMVGAE